MENTKIFKWNIKGLRNAIMMVSPKTVTVSYDGMLYVVLSSSFNAALRDNNYNNDADIEVRIYDKTYPNGHVLKCMDIKHF